MGIRPNINTWILGGFSYNKPKTQKIKLDLNPNSLKFEYCHRLHSKTT